MNRKQRETVAQPVGLRLVEKAVEVLDLLGQERKLTIAQLSEKTGEPRSSLYRLLGSLEKLEFVESAGSRGTYRLGVHALRLGAAMMAGLDERERALPVMNRIRDETGLTVYLLVRRGDHAVCVERIEGERVASLALQLGGSLPLHTGAAPRALLAFAPQEEWQRYVSAGPLVRLTPSTPSTRQRLFDVLSRERAEGVTTSDGDVTVGIAALGAPVFDFRGEVIAALSVSGLRDDLLGKAKSHLQQLVRNGAAEISASLGYTPDRAG
ncbi:IclR family transcriptional regulator [Mycolicibacterium agri]|uniref:IclR family transcriptional regulator n=1 Tax=Mycolicibacterium agri TaxID=36811 RepID=A0A2A7NF71_MYCAG|nr:IclR family transcriptional regulator [Mycolicibacterium agri]